jgi:hypothetical protein
MATPPFEMQHRDFGGRRQVVAVRLMGGLGNQMFQYAMGRRLSHESSRPLWLDLGGFRRDSKRRFELDAFTIKAHIARPPIVAEFHAPFDKLRGLRRMAARLNGSTWVWISDHSFDVPGAVGRAIRNGRPLYVEGYWQSPVWFKGIEDVLRKEFVLRKPLMSEVERIVAFSNQESTVGVHVRRGDFVNDPQMARIHAVCTADYYRKAARLMQDRVPGARFIVVSDEPNWVEANLGLAADQVTVPSGGERSAAADLSLLAGCRHHILSNSTFGWWAAWLSERTGSVVIAPDRWFVGKHKEPSGLIPAHWIRIGADAPPTKDDAGMGAQGA